MTLKRIGVSSLVMTLLVFLPTCPAPAELIEIQFTGLDVVYDGTDMHDAVDKAGGEGKPAQADELIDVSFLVDGSLVGTLSAPDPNIPGDTGDPIFADVLIRDIPRPPAGGGFVSWQGDPEAFGFDLLTSPGDVNAWGLALNIDKFQMFFAGPDIAFAATGTATTTRAPQKLPFGVIVDPDDRITIIASSTNLSNVASEWDDVDNMFKVAYFEASGTGSIRGTFIPEPSSFVLLAIAIAGLVGFGWKKRRAEAAC